MDHKTQCPDNEEFARILTGSASTEKKEKLLSHILECRKCKIKFDIVRALDLEAPLSSLIETASDKKSHKTGRSHQTKTYHTDLYERKTPLFRTPLFIIGLVAMIAVLSVVYFTAFRKEPTYRKPNPFGLELIFPAGELDTPPEVLKWTEVENADGYYITIIDENMTTVLDSKDLPTIQTTTVKLPESIIKIFSPGRTYLWEVRAFDDFDQTITSSATTFIIVSKE
jgi:hypothetical protein